MPTLSVAYTNDDARVTTVRLTDRAKLNERIGPKGLDISGRELARRAGLKQAIVGHLLSGRRTTCRPATAAAIAEAVGIDCAELFAPSASDIASDVPTEEAA